MFLKVLPTYIDAEFHGESVSDGFRAIRERKVGEKLKKQKRIFSGHILPKIVTPRFGQTLKCDLEHGEF